MTPDELARRLRHLEGDTAFKLNEEGLDRTYLLEDLGHRLRALADALEGRPEDEDDYVPTYELTDWDMLAEGHWV